MKIIGCLFALLSTPLLFAQRFEAGIFIGQQQYNSSSQAYRGPFLVVNAPDSNRVIAARFGVLVADFEPGRLQVVFGLQPEKSTPIPQPGSSYGSRSLQYENMTLGAGLSMNSAIALGAILEVRTESIRDVYAPGGTTGTQTNLIRPWLRLNLSYTFPSARIKPFLGLETSFPLSSPSSKAIKAYSSSEDVLKSMAPKSQAGFCVGARF